MDKEKLKRLRAEVDITQEELAKAMKVSKRTVENWECEKRPIKPAFELLIKFVIREFRHNGKGFRVG